VVTIHGLLGLCIWELGHHPWDFRSVDMGSVHFPYPQTILRSVDMGLLICNHRITLVYICGCSSSSIDQADMVYVHGTLPACLVAMVYVYGSCWLWSKPQPFSMDYFHGIPPSPFMTADPP